MKNFFSALAVCSLLVSIVPQVKADEVIGSLINGFENGLSGAFPCDPLAVSNGTVDAETCVITCEEGFVLTGEACVAVSDNDEGNGGGGGSSNRTKSLIHPGGETDSNIPDGEGNEGTESASEPQRCIEVLRSRGVLNEAGDFRGDEGVNRAEVVKILGLLVETPLIGFAGDPFPDVPASEWFGPYIAIGKYLNWIQGYSDGKFHPEKNVTRAEALKIVLLAAKIPLIEDGTSVFSDVHFGDWFFPYVLTGTLSDIISGYGDGTFRPAYLMSRFEFAGLVCAAFKL